MTDLQTLQQLKPELPTVVIVFHKDIKLRNAVTGRMVTIRRGRRIFVVAKRGNTRWLFWMSGLSQGKVVGTSDAFFVINLVETHLAELDSLPPMAAVA